MEFFIFLIIVVVSVLANSGKKPGSNQDQDWNIEEFDFSKIITKPPEQGSGRHDVPRVQGGQPSEITDYKDVKSDHVEDHSYDFSKLTGPKAPVPVARDAYEIKPVAGGGEVGNDSAAKSLGESMTRFAADTDSESSIDALAAAVSSGDVVDASTVKTVAERTDERKKRLAFKTKSTKEKSEAMDIETPASTSGGIDESSNLKDLFRGNNIRRSFVASLIFKRPEF